MRDVNFTEVGMENFGPYIDPMILTFPNNSLTLMTGPNGIGKTMALDAIPYTLYGVTSKGAKGDDVVNNVIGRNCKTWVKFSINADKYEVIRYRKYTRLNNTVTISKNGEDPYKKGQSEVLPELTKLLCPKKSFMNTLMFGQKVKDFFTDLVDSDKKEIFRMILNIDRYQEYYNEAKRGFDTISEYSSDTKNEIQLQYGLMQDAQDQIDILNNQKKQFYEQKENDIREIQKSIDTNQRLVDQWQETVDKLKSEQEDWKEIEQKLLDLEKAEEKIDAEFDAQREQLLNKKELKITELKSQAQNSDSNFKVKSLESESKKKDYHANLILKFNSEIDQLIEEKNEINRKTDRAHDAIHNAEFEVDDLKAGLQGDSCPTCLQPITEECIKNLQEKIAEKTKIIDEAKALIEKTLNPQKKEIFNKISQLNENKEKADEILKVDLKDIELIFLQQQDNNKSKLNGALEQVRALTENHLAQIKIDQQDALKPIYVERGSLTKIARKHQNLEKELDEAEMTLTTVQRRKIQKLADLRALEHKEFDDEQIFSYERKIREFEMEIEQKKAELEKAEIDLEIYEFWKAAFSPRGIPSMLIDESIPFMNERVSEYLDKLTNGRYVVSFDTLAETKSGEFRDKISVNVLDTHTRASSRIQLSGGQTRIIDIATILTLGDLQSNIQGVMFNILLFDEIFDSLDEENIGFVSKVLTNMKIDKSIYLISHRHEDQLEADEVLTLN